MCCRPHCGGYDYEIVGPPKTMSQYYAFHKPGAKAYKCLCPEGLGGDECNECTDTSDEFRYTKKDGSCALCDCTDLSLSKKCDSATGQCPCIPELNITLAGRQCVSIQNNLKCLKIPNL